jgi:hypothetical protein
MPENFSGFTENTGYRQRKFWIDNSDTPISRLFGFREWGGSGQAKELKLHQTI